MENAVKRYYHVDVTSAAEDQKIYEVLNFNFGSHKDIAAMVESVKKLGMKDDKHAKQLVLGVRFLHHVLKKYPDIEVLNKFFPAFEEFKKELNAKMQ